jgi:signal transduction histidine kinase
VPPQDQRSSKFWTGLIRWIQVNTFAPKWLPEQLRHPVVGYLAAALIEGAAVSLILVMLFLVPDFDYYAIFTLMGVVLVAIGWGTGPGLMATLVSTLLLEYVTATPRFSWTVDNLADGAGLVVYLVVGVSISVLAGWSGQTRRLALEKAHLLAQAAAQSRFESQRTREMLGAMVGMEEALVQVRPSPLPVDVSDQAVTSPAAPAVLPIVARRLAELTQNVLGCRRVSISAVNAATGQLAPVTEMGLSREQEQAWWSSWSPPQSVAERYSPAIAARLYAGEPTLLDRQQLPERFQYLLFGAQRGRIVPMRVGEELVGTLLIDYPEADHASSREDEILLSSALARLGALVLEQDRLLRGWAEARASELALGEITAQMDTFLGIASHELKTPLTTLKLGLQVAEQRLDTFIRGKQGVLGEPAMPGTGLQPTVELLSGTSLQVERMQRLVDDLVDVSRIQAGKLELRASHADLVAIVRTVVEEQAQVAPERTLSFQCPADLSVLVWADAGRIEQVVTNYLTNALKYSPADQPVDIGVEVEPQQVRVWVRDHGPGLPLEAQEHIWERFYRVEAIQVQSGSGVGLGLGLYISRMIIERHQGGVGVESAPGHGSTFWFTLPLHNLSEEKC